MPKDTRQRTNDERFSFTRRGWLQCAGSLAALSALPFEVVLAAQPASDVMMKLSSYMNAAAGRSLPDEVSEKAKQHILDTFAAMISGTGLPPGRAAMRFVASYAGGKTATIVASPVLCGAIEAALVNGMLAHSDETDDSHAFSRTHPGCAIVPAAFARSEE